MPYRNQSVEPVALDPALQKLARLGRLRRMADRERAAAEREQERVAQHHRESEAAIELRAERHARQLRSISPWHWLRHRGWTFLASVYVAAMISPFLMMGGVGTLGWSIWAGFAIAPMVSCVLARRQIRRTAQAQQRALEALPFAVAGHWGALKMSSWKRAAQIRFAGRIPPPEFLIDTLSAALPPALVAELELDANSDTVTVPAPSTHGDHNRAYRRWFEDLCELLLTLNAAYPVVDVRVVGD